MRYVSLPAESVGGVLAAMGGGRAAGHDPVVNCIAAKLRVLEGRVGELMAKVARLEAVPAGRDVGIGTEEPQVSSFLLESGSGVEVTVASLGAGPACRAGGIDSGELKADSFSLASSNEDEVTEWWPEVPLMPEQFCGKGELDLTAEAQVVVMERDGLDEEDFTQRATEGGLGGAGVRGFSCSGAEPSAEEWEGPGEKGFAQRATVGGQCGAGVQQPEGFQEEVQELPEGPEQQKAKDELKEKELQGDGHRTLAGFREGQVRDCAHAEAGGGCRHGAVEGPRHSGDVDAEQSGQGSWSDQWDKLFRIRHCLEPAAFDEVRALWEDGGQWQVRAEELWPGAEGLALQGDWLS